MSFNARFTYPSSAYTMYYSVGEESKMVSIYPSEVDMTSYSELLQGRYRYIIILLNEIHPFHHADDRNIGISDPISLACPCPRPPPQISILLQTATVQACRSAALSASRWSCSSQPKSPAPLARGNYPASMWRVESLVCELAEGCP
jgi:hypothetical protein